MLEVTGCPIERALAHCGGSHTLADIEAAVATGAMQAWNGDESAIITEIRETPAIHLGSLPGFETTIVKYTTDVPRLSAWGEPFLLGPGSIHVAHTQPALNLAIPSRRGHACWCCNRSLTNARLDPYLR